MGLMQYQIVLVNLDPTQGSEIKKTRPCVVISPNEMNNHLRTIIVAPMTTAAKSYPSRVPIVHNDTRGAIALDQIRTIDKSRVIKSSGDLKLQEIERCKQVLKEMLVD